ncbi:TM2 domain-containing protein [Cyanobium sp. ATX-6F1]|uniref:TM2 domain-containing protein n=1 Tax=Cyanobium sp. ATX-6F1 TaxID=3137388 RepID=UPI0039BE7CBB
MALRYRLRRILSGRFGATDRRAPLVLQLQERRSLTATYLLWALAFVGLCGIQRFYTRRPFSGALLLLTFGGCGLGQLVDLFLVPRLVRSANRIEGPTALPLDRQLLELARLRGEAGFHPQRRPAGPGAPGAGADRAGAPGNRALAVRPSARCGQ